ncbi:MAG: GNAT family N-acetyltransferase [Syntrophales bacterium]|nr:GNAT family N-acetyltransferase [Syntrophales bacterium]
MELRIQRHCEGIDWHAVRSLLKEAGMAYHRPESHERAFRNSYAVVFVFDGTTLIGFGRAVSDGAYQAAIYDVVVAAPYRKQGLGRTIMEGIMERLSTCNVILYANHGTDGFYHRFGFRPMTTAMGRFLRPEVMAERGFIR